MTHSPQGKLRRVSVAVALNQGKKALTQADLTKIDNLVKGAIGYDATRGDLVAINQRPFVAAEDTSPAFYDQGWFMPLVQQVGAILAALLAFLFIGRPMIRAAKNGPRNAPNRTRRSNSRCSPPPTVAPRSPAAMAAAKSPSR